MNAEQFVEIFKKEKDYFAIMPFSKPYPELRDFISKLELNETKTEILKKVFDLVLTDVFYTILLGLDGCASIGGIQQTYKIYDEDNNSISDCGDIEAAAYDAFHAVK